MASRPDGTSMPPRLPGGQPSSRRNPLSSPAESNFSAVDFASPSSDSSFPSSVPSLENSTPPRLSLSAPRPAHPSAHASSGLGVSTRATFRQLLAQVEQQLASLTELSCSVRARGFGSSALSLDEARETFETLRSDASSALARANRLLHELRVASSASSSSASSVCSAAQLRHFSDLLLSLKTECVSTCEAISLALDRAALLQAAPERSEAPEERTEKDEEASAAVFYAREAGSLRESNRMLSSILHAGSNALYALRKQKAVVGKMKDKVSEMSTGDVGAISGILGKIEWQGKKQKIILALVIAVCVCLSLVWVMRGHASAVEPGPG
ncbi:conserved hypothetical protein [Neospora caninum Liverpool]|uniref:Transmembrane protein n=1 Tax=Neospora caninum (strain Liverpool) TaxID=572307 RepID=F0VRA5_NEOCL|nr:conserved hypothetical protein [Neospora caninum Liverpool]CBZ56253.1 conserved hypothetical protein [Neospora caninum Liverpool]CEL71015.1 TPA: hypothetical protein BN1204_066780 [Neospora caninum Liverpool]|eukprot:XP_003886278.1 conserved hypothetical protein [Neospora caninum Liverpool]